MRDVSLTINKTIEDVPKKELRYDCIHTTEEGDTLSGISSSWKINYWQDICIFNEDVIGDYCEDECVIFAQCSDLPAGLTLTIPAVVVDYFPNCTTANSGNDNDDYDYDEDISLLDELEMYQILFFLMLGTTIILLLVIIILIAISLKRSSNNSSFVTLPE